MNSSEECDASQKMWKDQEENWRKEKYLDEKNFITGQYGHTEDTT